MDEALPRRRPPARLPGARAEDEPVEPGPLVPDIAGPVHSLEEAVQVTEMRFIFAWAQHVRAAGRTARSRAQALLGQRPGPGAPDGPAASGATPDETDEPRT